MQVGNILVSFPPHWEERLEGTRSLVHSPGDGVELICSAAQLLLAPPEDPADALQRMRLKTLSKMEDVARMAEMELDPDFQQSTLNTANGELVIYRSTSLDGATVFLQVMLQSSPVVLYATIEGPTGSSEVDVALRCLANFATARAD